MIEENIDIAVRISSSDVWPGGLGRRYLGTEKLIFCAAPAYLERRGIPHSADDLCDHDCILYGKGNGSTITWRFGINGKPNEQRSMNARIILGSAEAQVCAVKAGFGVAQLATWLIRDELQRGELLQVLPTLAAEGLPLHLVWPISRQLSPKVDAFIEMLANGLCID